MKPISINPAEAILDPLWDPALSGFSRKLWTLEPGEAHGLKVSQNWCWLLFEWARRPATGPALTLSRKLDADAAAFDHFLVSAMLPRDSRLRVRLETDLGSREQFFPPAGVAKKEYSLPLDGATTLHSVTLQIEAGSDGASNGWFNWIGLQNAQTLPAYLGSLRNFDPAWEQHLLPESYEPTFTPSYGLVISPEELEAARVKHAAYLREHGESPYTLAAERAMQINPESEINDFVNFWGDTRYCRERDHGKGLLGSQPEHGVALVLAAQLTRDPKLLRLAARFAICLAHCQHWDDGMITRLPGSSWEHRCFVQSICCHVLGITLDLAGEMFTWQGRDFILRRLAENGIGTINYNTWRHSYIFGCNQLAWFSPARLLVYGILEKHYTRIQPYTELAYQELLESLEKTVLPDGGYVEGPSYFDCVGGFGGMRALSYYARARGKTLFDVLPDCIRRAADFGAAVASTDEESDVVPICDCWPIAHTLLAGMAAALPDSQWVNLYRKSLKRSGGLPDQFFALQLDPLIPESAPPLPTLVKLPVMGIVASHRKWNGQPVKLFLMGNLAGAGHTHEDKGSFVLEVAGETLACDVGTCDYASPFAREYQTAQRHSMLLPTGTAERPAPECPLNADIRPDAEGDELQFKASVELTPGWEKFYQRWHRSWDSPSPDQLIITDEYALKNGEGVDFLCQTKQPATVEGSTVILQAKRSILTLDIPPGCSARVELLPLFNTASTQQRIVIHSPNREGTLQIVARWRAREAG